MQAKRIRLSLSVVAVAILTVAAASETAAQATDRVAQASSSMEAATYYGGVQAVLEQNCTTCHTANPVSVGGMIAPFSLTTFQDARRYASRIARAVRDDYMPPWDAALQHQGQFKNERYLAPEDKQLLIEWAEAGAPMGDASQALPPSTVEALHTQEPTVAPDGRVWLMGMPDMVVGFEEPIRVCAAIEDWQPQVPQHVISGAISEPKWIRGTEINAGPIVHHTVSSVLGVGTPGRGPFEFPEGWGILLLPDQYMSISMHYHKEVGTEYVDDTRGGIDFYDDGDRIDYVVETELQPFRDFVIPAGHPNYEVQQTTVMEDDIYLLSMGPHAHYRGKAVKIEIQRPDRPFREVLLNVPDYDFNWQFQYEFKEPIFIPAGTQMITTWWYDNSAANPYNPDPTVDVTYGAATTDEMMNSRIYFARAQPMGLRAGDPIPQELIDRARQADQQARRFATEWESGSESCTDTAVGVASR